MDVAIAYEGQPHYGFLQGRGLGRYELRIQPRRRDLLGVVVLEEAPGAHVLIAILHAILPVRAVWRWRHAPFWCAVLVNHRQALLGHVSRESRVPEDLLGDVALSRHGPRLAEGHALRFSGRILLHPVDVLGQSVNGRWRIGGPAARHRGAYRRAFVVGNPYTPLVNRHAIGRALVGRACHGQPRIGEAPTQRGVFLAIVHVPVDRLAV